MSWFRHTLWLLVWLTTTAAATTLQPVTLPSLDVVAGEPVQLKGWYAQPDGSGPFPAVVAMHGCGGLYARSGGINARHQAMADMLLQHGYAVLLLDSFTSRGVRQICTLAFKDRPIHQSNRRRDALGALLYLRQQPAIRPDHIALLGWSNGGSSVLASVNAAHPEVAAAPYHYRAAIAFYPGCKDALEARRGFRLTSPLHIHIGAADDWTPAAPCKALAARTQAPDKAFAVFEYPDAYHDFDAPHSPVRLRTDVPHGVNPGQGVHVGTHPAARAAAYERVLTFLQQQLQEQ